MMVAKLHSFRKCSFSWAMKKNQGSLLRFGATSGPWNCIKFLYKNCFAQIWQDNRRAPSLLVKHQTLCSKEDLTESLSQIWVQLLQWSGWTVMVLHAWNNTFTKTCSVMFCVCLENSWCCRFPHHPHLLCNLNHQSGVKLVNVAAFPRLLVATHHLQRGSTELPWLHRPHQTYHVVSQLSRQRFAWRCGQHLTKTWTLQSAPPLGGGNNAHSVVIAGL